MSGLRKISLDPLQIGAYDHICISQIKHLFFSPLSDLKSWISSFWVAIESVNKGEQESSAPCYGVVDQVIAWLYCGVVDDNCVMWLYCGWEQPAAVPKTELRQRIACMMIKFDGPDSKEMNIETPDFRVSLFISMLSNFR